MAKSIEALDYVGHHQEYSPGHYEARVIDNGKIVVITTVFDDPKGGPHTVTLNLGEWERLVAWVQWARKELEFERTRGQANG